MSNVRPVPGMLSIVAFVEHELIELASSSSSMYALVPWLAFHPVSYWLRPNTSSNSNNRLRSLSLNFGRFHLLRLTAQGLESFTGLGCCLFVMKFIRDRCRSEEGRRERVSRCTSNCRLDTYLKYHLALISFDPII